MTGHERYARGERGVVRARARTLAGVDLGCLPVYPRAESTEALVGVAAGTAPAGLRVTERLPIFSSGVRYPDLTILGAEVLERGNAGVRVAGFFGNDRWIERGEFAWHDAASRPPATGSPPAPALIGPVSPAVASPGPTPVPAPTPGMGALSR